MAIFILSAEGYRRNICHVFTCKRKILDSRLLWIKHNNVKNRILRSQKDPYKDWSNNVKKADVNNISTGQYRSSGLLGKTTNIQNIYYCKIVKGSYMVWRGKVWLLRGLMVLAVWMRYASRAFLRQSRSQLCCCVSLNDITLLEIKCRERTYCR